MVSYVGRVFEQSCSVQQNGKNGEIWTQNLPYPLKTDGGEGSGGRGGESGALGSIFRLRCRRLGHSCLLEWSWVWSTPSITPLLQVRAVCELQPLGP